MREATVKRLGVMAAAFVMAVAIGAPVEAGPGGLATGALAFEGTADLSAGTWAGTFTGELSGSYREADGQVVPWSVLLVNPATADPASVDILGCAAGTVAGTFRVKTDDYGQVFGLWQNNVIARSIVAVDATFDFVWQRAGGAGALAITAAVVDIQLYTEPWTGFDTATGWVRVVDSSHVTAGAGAAHLDTGDATACDEGVWRGAVADLAVAAP